jgi:HK97 family phage portal protein
MSIRQALSKFVDEARKPDLTSLELRSSSLNNPSVPLSAAGFLAWATGSEPTASGEQVTVNTALQQATVYACVRVLAEAVASLPLYVYELLDKGRKKSFDHPLAYLLSSEPNEEMTAFTFWESFVGALALTGNGYAEIQRDGGGRPVALWPLHPQLTEPMRAKNGDLVYQTTDGMVDGKQRTILAADMLHVPLFSFNGLKGFSPIWLARQGIGLAIGAQKYGSRFFGNGARPSGILSCAGTLSPKQKTEAQESWNQTQGGENSGSTAVLPGNWTYTQIGISPEDSQFLETRQFQRAEIAALFRVQPHQVGDTTRMSNNNAEQMNLSFVTDTLRPYLCRIELESLRKLFPRVGRNSGHYSVEFDVSERLRGDFKSTMDGYAVGKQWGFYNTNTVLEDLGKNPIGPLGDVYLVPVNYQNAERLLDTESIQDVPLNANGDIPATDGDGAGAKATTGTERDLLGRFTRAYLPIFCDAFSRLLKRDKRDFDTISVLLRPVFRSIADPSMLLNGSTAPAPEAILDDLLKSMAKRAAGWAAHYSVEDAAELARTEFLKALRSIHINISRECAAQRAAAQLAAPTEAK